MEGLVCIALFVGMLALIYWGLVWGTDSPIWVIQDSDDQRHRYDRPKPKPKPTPKHKEVRPFEVFLALMAGLDKTHVEEVGIFTKDFNWAFRVKSAEKFIAAHICNGDVTVKVFGDSPEGRIMHTTKLDTLRAPVELEAFVRYFVGLINATAASKDAQLPAGWYR